MPKKTLFSPFTQIVSYLQSGIEVTKYKRRTHTHTDIKEREMIEVIHGTQSDQKRG